MPFHTVQSPDYRVAFMATARGLSLDRSKSLARERALEQDIAPLVGHDQGVDHDVATPDEELAVGVQARFGNDLIQQSMAGALDGGLGSLVLADFAMASVGVAGSGLLGASNTAMLAIMRDAHAEGPVGPSQGERVNRALQRGGRALPADLQARLESAFGISLKSVEIHDDAAAADASEAVSAHAFTMGTDIFFGRGEFAPGTHRGDELIAHEVTHVVQHLENRSGRPTAVEGDVPVTRPTDAVEQEAYAFGESFADGAVGTADSVDVGFSAPEVSTPAGDTGVAARDTNPAPAPSGGGTPAPGAPAGDEAQREPTAEETAALQSGTTNVANAQAQAAGTNAPPDVPVMSIQEDQVCVAPPTGGSPAPQNQAPVVTPTGPTITEPGDLGAIPADPVAQYMDAHGPAANVEAGAAAELAGASWDFVKDAFGPLVAYDRKRGGFDFTNLWGVAKGVDEAFEAANKDRGEGGLATTIKVIDTLRSVTETIGSISGSVGLTCSILSLIGLFPPLAPVGAALLAVGGICGTICEWCSIIATCLSLVTSVLSAIQLVQAVRDGAPNVAELYALFEEDCANLVTNGINWGMDKLWKAAEGPRTEGAGHAMESLGHASSAVDGRVARGAAYQGLKSMEQAAPGLLNTKGMTRQALTSMLVKQTALGVGGKVLSGASYKFVDNLERLGMKTNTDPRAHQIHPHSPSGHLSSIAAHATAPIPTPWQSFKTNAWQVLAGAPTPAPAHDTPIPVPEHAPHELADIAAQRQAIADARHHVSGQRDSANAAISGGESLIAAATEHGQSGQQLGQDAQSHQGGLARHAQQAQEGERQAVGGQTQTGRMGTQTTSLQAEAKDKQGRANATQMPEKPKADHWWNKVANWFQEQVFARVSAALGAVREFMANIILQVVAFFMNVSDIGGKLQEAQSGMHQAGETTHQTQDKNKHVQAQAQEVQTQAQTATTDAQSAVDEGTAIVSEADARDAQLAEEDRKLEAEAAAIEAYIAQYTADNGEQITGPASEETLGQDVADAYAGELQSLLGGMDEQEASCSELAQSARDSVTSEASEAGIDSAEIAGLVAPLESNYTLWHSHFSGHRHAIADAAVAARGFGGKPLQAARDALGDFVNDVSAVLQAAYGEIGAFRRAVAEYLVAIEARLRVLSQPAPAANQSVSRKADSAMERGAGVDVAPKDGGSALPAGFAAQLGSDAAGVRVHTGSDAAAFAEGMNAKAATVGRDIYFAGGEYDPGSRAGQELLAHEVHHAVEGGGGPGISQPGDTHERAADAFASSFVAGESPTLEAGSLGSGISLKEDEDAGREGEVQENEAPPGTDVDALLQEGTDVADAGRSDKPVDDGTALVDSSEEVEVAPDGEKKDSLGLNAPGGQPNDKKGDKNVKPAENQGQKQPSLNAPKKVQPAVAPSNNTPKGESPPEVLAAVERIRGAGDAEKQGISTEGEAQKAQVRAAGEAQKAAVRTASATLAANIAGDFARLAQDIQVRGEAAKSAMMAQRDQQKSLITAAAQAEITRMQTAVTDRRNQLTQLGQQLSEGAKAHGQNEAARALQLAQGKAEKAQAIGNTKAGQYANFEEAKEIAATARKMGRETAAEILKQSAEVAAQCIKDGEALATKLSEDTEALLKNLGDGIAPSIDAVNQARDKALASCDQSYTDAAAQVDSAVAQALVGVESGKTAALASAASVAEGMLPSIDNAVEQACATIDEGVVQAHSQIDSAVAEIVASSGNVDPKRLEEALALLGEAETALADTGAGAKAGLGTIATEMITSIVTAGQDAATQVLASGESITTQNAAVKTQFDASMAQIETSTAGGFAQAGTDSGAKMTEAADAFIGKLDEGFNEGKGKLEKTSADGKGEITKKVNDVIKTIDESLSTLGAEIDKKAKEIENASWWDKLCSAVGGFFKGFFSQLWNWVKDILLVLAIVLVVLVILVVLIVVLVAIFPGLLGPLLAGLIFLAVWGPLILTVVGYIGLAVGVIMAAVSVYQSWKAWNNPNLTWEEKWEQTGRTTFDIVDAIGPEKFLKPIAGVFKSAKGVNKLANAVEGADKLAGAGKTIRNAENVVEGAKNVEHLVEGAKNTEKLVEGAKDTEKLVEGAKDLAKAEDAGKLGGKAADAVKDAEELAKDGKKLTHADDTAKLEEAKKLGGVDDAKRVNEGKLAEEGAKLDDAKKIEKTEGAASKVDDAKKAEETAVKADDGKKALKEAEDAAAKTTDAKGGASGKKWDDPTLTKDEFITDYRKKYPKSGLTDAELADRFEKGKRLNPETGKLGTPEWMKQTPAAGKGKMNNAEIREWYNKEVGRLEELDNTWKAQGLNAEERARRAHAVRHEARMKAREMMSNADEVEGLRKRDMEVYGNPDGPTFEQLIEKSKKKGLQGDAVYEDIAGSSTRTNAEFNAKNGVKGKNESASNNSSPKGDAAQNVGKTEDLAKSKAPSSNGPSGKKWDDKSLTEAEFIADYRARHPNSKLPDEKLAEHFKNGDRLNPETGRMKKPMTQEVTDPTKKVSPEASDPTKGAPKHVDVPKSANNAEDVLSKSAAELKGNPEAQKRLFEAVQESNTKMQKAAEDIAHELGVDVPQTGIKGNKPGGKLDQQKFIDGVLEKNARNNYDTVGQMKDMTRGRFELDSAQEVEAAANKLVERFSKEFGTDAVNWKKPKGDYPRHHVLVTDPATGIAHEWQIGSKATTKFIEGMDVPLPSGVKLHAKPDFHTVKYDVLDKLNDPAVRAKHGLPDDIGKRVGLDKLEEQYAQLFRETGTTTKGAPLPKDFEVRQKALADEMGRIMNQLEAEHPGIVQKLDSKLQGAAHADDAAKAVNQGADVVKVADAPKVPKSANNAEDILSKGSTDLKNSEAAQQKLFDAVQETNKKMQKAADDIADEIGVDRIQTGIKGNKPGGELDRAKFIDGVLEKNARNDYKKVGQMTDMTRARFDLDGAEQVEAAAQKLADRFTKEFGAEFVNWKKPKGDYPRHHILVTDPATGIAHEWQIGSKATTKFIEGMEVPLPSGVHLHAKADFHVVKYDVLDKLHDPKIRAKHGLPDDIADKVGLNKLEQEYNQLFRETGKTTKGQPLPTDFEARQKALAKDMGDILAKLEAENPGIVGKLDTKGAGKNPVPSGKPTTHGTGHGGDAGHGGGHDAGHGGKHEHSTGEKAWHALETGPKAKHLNHQAHELHEEHEAEEGQEEEEAAQGEHH